MAQRREKMESYCSPSELAYAEAFPNSRLAHTLGQLRVAVALVNAKPGAGRPTGRRCVQLLNQAALSKEDAYWGVQKAVDAFALAPATI